jgi:hypothetical protein
VHHAGGGESSRLELLGELHDDVPPPTRRLIVPERVGQRRRWRFAGCGHAEERKTGTISDSPQMAPDARVDTAEVVTPGQRPASVEIRTNDEPALGVTGEQTDSPCTAGSDVVVSITPRHEQSGILAYEQPPGATQVATRPRKHSGMHAAKVWPKLAATSLLPALAFAQRSVYPRGTRLSRRPLTHPWPSAT